ncbi:MAG: sugar ABC transporter substrate-binding protein [Paenibacillaceae bacterium ZCTH02-B3]|nr:MAG: sugar ABC transporter substrate-binding protein [Paenibacillaceae bacterium ZCTH02-B3]
MLAVCLLALAMALTACSRGGQSSDGSPSPSSSPSPGAAQPAESSPAQPETVTVKFTNFSASGDNEKVLQQMKEEFERQNPHIKVDIETLPFNDYFTQMQTRVASGTAPDAYELNYENFIAYAKKGVLLDLTPLFGNFDTSALNKNALEAFRADGKQYGLPASFSNVVLFYNKDLFDQAGIDYPTSSWTWADVNAAAEKIRALGKDIFGIYQPVQFWEFYKTVRQNGGGLMNDDMTAFTVDRPENVETLQHLVDRILKTNVMPTEAQMAGMGDWDLFKSGRLGMLVTGIWAFPDFASNITFNWDIEVEPGNKQKATHFFSNGLVINKDSKVAEAAFEWVKFMSASREAAMIRVEAGWELPAVTYEDVQQKYLQVTPPDNKKAVFESLDYLVTPPVVEQNAEMTDIINLHLQAAAMGAKSPADALRDAQAELEKRINL